MKKIVDIQVDSVKFSFQGVNRKSYCEMRNKDYFNELVEKIRLMTKIRGKSLFPYIHVSTTTTYESDEEIQEFKEKLEEYVDCVTVGKTKLAHIDIQRVKLDQLELATLQKLKDEESLIKKHHSCCPEVYDKLSINWDGTVSACCSDYDNFMVVGNLYNQTLEEIWHSEKLNLYRKILSNNDYDKISLCQNCFDYIPLKKAHSVE